jgi:hypothetical protein
MWSFALYNGRSFVRAVSVKNRWRLWDNRYKETPVRAFLESLSIFERNPNLSSGLEYSDAAEETTQWIYEVPVEQVWIHIASVERVRIHVAVVQIWIHIAPAEQGRTG